MITRKFYFYGGQRWYLIYINGEGCCMTTDRLEV